MPTKKLYMTVYGKIVTIFGKTKIIYFLNFSVHFVKMYKFDIWYQTIVPIEYMYFPFFCQKAYAQKQISSGKYGKFG